MPAQKNGQDDGHCSVGSNAAIFQDLQYAIATASGANGIGYIREPVLVQTARDPRQPNYGEESSQRTIED